MIFNILCLLLPTLTLTAVVTCNAEHSTVFKNWNTRISYSILFITDTRTPKIFDDPCMRVTNEQFRAAVKAKGITLHSDWHVEHIIDTQNSECAECEKSIAGNLIIAYGPWNQGVGNLCWEYAKAEKTTVYGREIMRNAENAVYSCNGRLSPGSIIEIVVITLFVVFVLIAAAYIYYRKRANDMKAELWSMRIDAGLDTVDESDDK